MLVVSIAGSPGTQSRSGELLTYAAQQLQRRGVEIVSYRVRDFAAEDLLQARFDSPRVRQLLEHVQQAEGVIIATPVYKASFSGALKALLDLLPERALADKVVLPIASGGSSAHRLAVDYALKPVLAALKAQKVLQGIYAEDAQIQYAEADRPAMLDPLLREQLDEALEQLLTAMARRPQPLDLASRE